MKVTPKLCQLANLPEVHWQATLERIPEHLKYKEIVGKYCTNIPTMIQEGQGMYLWGPYSAGKSAIAALCVKSALENRIMAFWTTSKGLPGMIINGDTSSGGTPVKDIVEEVPLLIIDEFQVRKEVKYTESLTEDIVRRRVDRRLATIVTSNIVVTELERDFPAFYAILKDGVLPIHIHGYDFRNEIKGVVANGL